MKILLMLLLFIVLAGNVYANESKVKGLMDIYKEGLEEGQRIGYEKGYYEGYKQAVEDFKQLFQEKLTEYKALEAGKFLLKNWYISYPKVFQVITDKGVEIVVEGCKVMKPFDDLVEKIYSKIPVISKDISVKTEKLQIKNEQDLILPVTRKMSKKYIQEIQQAGLKYIAPIEQDYVIVFFDSEKSAEKFCVMYGCL